MPEAIFSRLTPLYSKAALEAFASARVAVIGVGGVGSWTAEALVRNGIRHVTLIDSDEVEVTNINRQLQALHSTVGTPKVKALGERLLDINPELDLRMLVERVLPETVDDILTDVDSVLDCIDSIDDKAALIACAKKKNLAIYASGGAGGKLNPDSIAVADLALTTDDPLLASVRRELRHRYGFPAQGASKSKSLFGVKAVYCAEPMKVNPEASSNRMFGTAVFMTATFGMRLAAELLNDLADKAL